MSNRIFVHDWLKSFTTFQNLKTTPRIFKNSK
uniref:Uncharacterized protein n=1 Tax=Arundo donax TaxID=35708 RepID=A0A0A9ARE4_ARUDO